MGGGCIVKLATGATGSQLAVDAQYVYFWSPSELTKAPITGDLLDAGGGGIPLVGVDAGGGSSRFAFVIGGGSAYVTASTRNGPSTIFVVGLDGGTLAPIAAGPVSATDIDVAKGYLYGEWANYPWSASVTETAIADAASCAPNCPSTAL
jgi:hypothetical protein